MRKNITGFTIVELLIVIAVIAILASITVVSYRGAKGRAYDASVQTDLHNFLRQIETYAADNGGDYPPSAALSDPRWVAFLKTVSFDKKAYRVGQHVDNLIPCGDSDKQDGASHDFQLIALSRSGAIFSASTKTGSVAPVEKENPNNYDWTAHCSNGDFRYDYTDVGIYSDGEWNPNLKP